MDRNLKIAILLVATLFACHVGRCGVLESYRSWPMGLSVSLTMSAEKLQQVKEAGFDYVEVTLNSQRKTSDAERLAAIERFRADAQRIGLTVWSIHLPFGRDWDISSTDESLREQCVSSIAWFIDAVQILQPQKLVLHPSAEPIADSVRVARIACSVRSIDRLTAIADKIGAQLLIEELPRTCLCNNSLEMRAFMEQLPPQVGVCFDTNHLLQESPQDFVKNIGSRITSLHVSDYDGIDERHWLMGRGIIAWPEVVAAIVAAGYEGVFLFEVGGYDSFVQIADSWREVERKLKPTQQPTKSNQ